MDRLEIILPKIFNWKDNDNIRVGKLRQFIQSPNFIQLPDSDQILIQQYYDCCIGLGAWVDLHKKGDNNTRWEILDSVCIDLGFLDFYDAYHQLDWMEMQSLILSAMGEARAAGIISGSIMSVV